MAGLTDTRPERNARPCLVTVHNLQGTVPAPWGCGAPQEQPLSSAKRQADPSGGHAAEGAGQHRLGARRALRPGPRARGARSEGGRRGAAASLNGADGHSPREDTGRHVPGGCLQEAAVTEPTARCWGVRGGQGPPRGTPRDAATWGKGVAVPKGSHIPTHLPWDQTLLGVHRGHGG